MDEYGEYTHRLKKIQFREELYNETGYTMDLSRDHGQVSENTQYTWELDAATLWMSQSHLSTPGPDQHK